MLTTRSGDQGQASALWLLSNLSRERKGTLDPSHRRCSGVRGRLGTAPSVRPLRTKLARQTARPNLPHKLVDRKTLLLHREAHVGGRKAVARLGRCRPEGASRHGSDRQLAFKTHDFEMGLHLALSVHGLRTERFGPANHVIDRGLRYGNPVSVLVFPVHPLVKVNLKVRRPRIKQEHPRPMRPHHKVPSQAEEPRSHTAGGPTPQVNRLAKMRGEQR